MTKSLFGGDLMKKLMMLALVLVLALSLTACGGPSNSDDNGNSGSSSQAQSADNGAPSASPGDNSTTNTSEPAADNTAAKGTESQSAGDSGNQAAQGGAAADEKTDGKADDQTDGKTAQGENQSQSPASGTPDYTPSEMYDITDDQIIYVAGGTPASEFPAVVKKGVATFKNAVSANEKFLQVEFINPTEEDVKTLRDYYLANGGTLEVDTLEGAYYSGMATIVFEWGEVRLALIPNAALDVYVSVD
jgi:hypothetical protein